MAVVHILALWIVILYLAYYFKEKIVDVMPAAVSLLVLLLYGLAFLRHMSFIDMIDGAILLLAAIHFLSQTKDRKKEILLFCKDELLHPGCIVAIITIAAVSICVSGKLVTWWDDYNFWATDAKALFYMDGFAGKYGNVAAEFGDYPPGTQMMKWWFLHLSPDTFKEGLMFAGYYAMNLTFLMPLMRRLPGRNIVILVMMPIFLWIFPNVTEQFYLSGSCADLSMGIVYGAFLASVADEEGHGAIFYYGRLALYLMLLVLLKNVGFIWAAFGIIYFCAYRLLVWKKENRIVCCNTKREWLAIGMTILLPILAESGWLLFCLRMRRVAKLTGTAVIMATEGVHLPDYSGELIRAFFEAFCIWPLHRWKTWGLDLSPLILYIIICLMTVIMYKRSILDKVYALFMAVFFAVSGVIFYSFNLISHLTIFAIEEQYLEPFGMVSSIERYGAPFMIGGLYFLVFLWLNRAERKHEGENSGFYKKYAPYLLCFVIVFICVDHKMSYEGLIGYRKDTEKVVLEREEILNGSAKQFLRLLREEDMANVAEEEAGARILYLRDGKNASWVQNTYVSFESSPVSMMYGTLFPSDMGSEDVVKAVVQSHATYLYADDTGEAAGHIFDSMAEGGVFCYNTLYKVDFIDGAMRLSVKEQTFDGWK